MKAKIDTHTHSIASGHYTTDTITKMAEKSRDLGLYFLAITDHAPKMIGTTNESYFHNLKYSDKKLYGVNMLYGVELNILNLQGDVDLPESILKNLDFAIASLHSDVFTPSSEEANTKALTRAMENPFVKIIGHPDAPLFPVNNYLLTDKAKETNTALELSSVSLSENNYRGDNMKGLIEMLILCKQKGVYITLGSDSHGKQNIGDFQNSERLLEVLDFPDELVLNYDIDKFFEFIKK